jgi:hypothetical protein
MLAQISKPPQMMFCVIVKTTPAALFYLLIM